MSDGKALTAFEPSEHQRGVLSAFQDADYGCRVQDACQAAGISKQAYYLWFDNSDFADWWKNQANRFFALQSGRVQHATLMSATTDAPGDPRAQKLYFERNDHDYCPRQRQEIAAEVEVTHGVDPTELCELAAAAMSARPGPEPDVAPVGTDGGCEKQEPPAPVA
jgi:hypothetical protein